MGKRARRIQRFLDSIVKGTEIDKSKLHPVYIPPFLGSSYQDGKMVPYFGQLHRGYLHKSNKDCPCKSGLKYKKCCKGYENVTPRLEYD